MKVLITKLGLDGHDRGAKVVALALRDAGFEVIYTGLHQSPEQVVQTALEEDVSAIGVSILSGSYGMLVPKLMELLKEKGLDIPVVVGGVILPKDIPFLKEKGVREVFGVGTPLPKIVDFFKKLSEEKGEN